MSNRFANKLLVSNLRVIRTLVTAVQHLGDPAAVRGELPRPVCCETFGILDAVVHVHCPVGVAVICERIA